MNNRKLIAVCFSLTLLFTGAALAWWPFDNKKKDAESSQASVKVDASPVERRTATITSFAPIVKKFAPSVISISTTKKVKSPDRQDDLFFRRFFGDPSGDDDSDQPQHPRQRKIQGLGSGVIITADGYIVTSNHVIEGMDEIVINVSEGKGITKEYKAKVVGTDPRTDVAVLKVDAKELVPATLGDSDKIEVGDIVLALGSPFGLSQTVTQGIISALSRNINIIQRGSGFEDFIQTDAAINPGNSGGALVDVEGRLIGINTAIFSRTGGSVGIGFAVPINLVKNVMDQIITKGKVVRGFIGVQIQPLTPELAESFKLSDNVGALIGDVINGSPAAEAGLRPSDIIIEVDGKQITDPRHLQLQISQMAPGTKVQIKVLREGKPKAFTVTLKELPDAINIDAPNDNPSKKDSDAKAPAPRRVIDGLELGTLDAPLREQLKVPDKIKGAIVKEVNPDSRAYEQGVRPGDILIEVESKPVASPKDVYDLLATNKKDKVVARVWRNGARFVVLPIKDK